MTCMICLDVVLLSSSLIDTSSFSTAIELNCQHYFHDKCFFMYINSLFDSAIYLDLDFVIIKCPLCRKEVSYRTLAVYLNDYISAKKLRRKEVRKAISKNKIEKCKVKALRFLQCCYRTKHHDMIDKELECQEEIEKFNVLDTVCTNDISLAREALRHIDPDASLRLHKFV